MMWFIRSYILFLLSYCLGNFLYPTHSILFHVLIWGSCAPVFYANRRCGMYVLLLIVSFEVGMGLRHYRENEFTQSQQHTKRFANRRMWIEGKVLSHPVPSDNGYSYVLETARLMVDGEMQNEKFLVQIFSKTLQHPNHGDVVQVQTKLYMFANPKNLQKLRHIQAYGTVFQDKQFRLLKSSNSLSTRVRDHIFSIAKKNLSETNFKYYRVMVFGDQALLNQRTMTRLKETGLLHLFVISASHITGVWFIAFGLLRCVMGWIPRFHRSKYFFTGIELGAVGIVFLFLQLINPPISTFRAVSSMVLFFILKSTHRSQHSLWNLGFVFFLIQIANPLYLFDVSTQLTFASVGGILVATHFFETKKTQSRTFMGDFRNKIMKASLATVGATMFTTPILYFHFKKIYMASFFYNLIVVPTLGNLLSMVSVASLLWAMIPVESVQKVGFLLLNQLFNVFEKILYADLESKLYTLQNLFSSLSNMWMILAGFLIGILLLMQIIRNRKQLMQF